MKQRINCTIILSQKLNETDFLRFFMFFISLIVMFSVILNNTVLYYNAYFLCYISVVF